MREQFWESGRLMHVDVPCDDIIVLSQHTVSRWRLAWLVRSGLGFVD
jgi:hypothetical protein